MKRLKKINELNILVVGDIIIDRYIMAGRVGQSAEADVPRLTDLRTTESLGGAGNVVANLRAFGAKSQIASIIGDDDLGRRIRQMLSTTNCDGLLVDPNRKSSLKIRITDADFNQFLALDDHDTHPPNATTRTNFLNILEDLMNSGIFNAVILQDYDRGCLDRQTITYILDKCTNMGITTISDPKYRNFEVLSHADIFKPNLNELRHAAGRTVLPDIEDLHRTIQDLGISSSCQRLFVTLSENGIYYFSEGKSAISSAEKIDHPDVSGAGDAVLAALAVGHHLGLENKAMARLGNAVGAAICREKGVSAIDPHDAIQIVSSL